MNLLRSLCCIATPFTLGAALLLPSAQAQVAPAAYGPTQSLWVGAEYSNFSASFPYQSGHRVQGLGGFVDLDLNRRLGFEGNARFLRFGGFEGSTENTFLAGPKVFFLATPKLRPYGKLLLGLARIHYPFGIGDDSYLALAPGAGTEYRFSPRWGLRFAYEYQIWHDSPGLANEPDHPLRPNGLQVGISYRLSR